MGMGRGSYHQTEASLDPRPAGTLTTTVIASLPSHLCEVSREQGAKLKKEEKIRKERKKRLNWRIGPCHVETRNSHIS